MAAIGLEKQVQDLSAVLEVARRMGAASTLDELLDLVIAESMRVLDAERASLFLYDQAKRELYSKIAVGAGEIRFRSDQGIAGAAATGRCTVNVSDAYADPRFNRDVDRKTGFHTRNLLACPLSGVAGQLVGVLQVLNKRGRPFDESDVRLAETLAAQAGVALERSRFLEDFVERQRMARELQLASAIQHRLLPQRPPNVAGYDIAGWNKPCDETGGDCYDFLELGDGRAALVVGDATGHGIGPSLISTECRALVRAVVSLTSDLRTGLEHVNRLLCSDLDAGLFVTLFLGLLDGRAHRLPFMSAGQGPILLYRRATGAVETLSTNGPPLGIDADIPYDEPHVVELAPGDLLAVLTDGFYEWPRPDGERVGDERITSLLRQSADRPARELIQELYQFVLAFADGRPQTDDLTAVIVKRIVNGAP